MAVELISEIIQKNNGEFPLLDSNNLRGGFYSVNTEAERDKIPTARRKVGMLCYVIENNKYYRLNTDGTWGKANLGGSGIIQINTFDDISNLDEPEVGQLVYVKDTCEYWYMKEQDIWIEFSPIVVDENEPTNTAALWVDPVGDSEINKEGNLTSIRSSISTLQTQMEQVIKILQYGAIAGDSSIGGRTKIMSSASPINPNPEDEDEEESQEIEPTHLEYTLPNISIKRDTLENFSSNYRNLLDGELIWVTDKSSLYIYINGKFVSISNGKSDDDINPDDDMTQEDIEKLYFNNLGFTNSKGDQYKMEVNDDGNIIVYNSANYDGNIGNKGTYGSYISDYLRINSIFLGGVNTKLDSFSACSHNFVELANSSEVDINLNGIYLLYRAAKVSSWTSLALRGIIKAGSTFLIRGARCSYKSNITLDVNSYDQEWKVSNKLIQFDNTEGGCFYLVCSDGGQFYNGTEKVNLSDLDGYNPYSADSTPIGYVDFVGIQLSNTSIPSEGSSPVTINTEHTPKDCIFVRSFPLDPCSQAQKNHNKKKSSALWTYVNMSKEGTEGFPYYSAVDKHLFVPKGSALSKNIFGVRSTFSETKPNVLNITFGIQATDAGNGATRCFNWISVGYYDEYIEYKKSTDDWTSATKVYSINANNTYSDDNIEKYKQVYGRIKWVTTNGTSVTTHKTIVRGLSSGTYDVRVRRDDDDNYIGDILHFTVRSDEQVNSGFSFVQTTDQQAFNFYEYQAWTKSAYAIHKNHPDIQFTINTGDMTQNGNRENEWIDYHNGRKDLANIEDMVTIGNNDLCGITPYALGNGDASLYKINHKNIQYYYCFELSTDNPAIFTYNVGSINTDLLGDVLSNTSSTFTYYMPSVYSFNYGKYHFICLNSEFTENTYSCYYNLSTIGNTFKQHAFYNMYKWLEADCDNTRNNIAFMHELPICIIKQNDSTGIAEDRTITNGSKLNNEFTSGIAVTPGSTDTVSKFAGGCNFSEFFQLNNIKLCLGGHKHTYSLSNPILETVTYNDDNRTVTPASPTEDTSTGVTYAMCQATGYKLVSNKELPGQGISWNKKYFPVTAASKVNTGQYYPMYSLFNATSSSIVMQSYRVENVYQGTTSFNINNQNSNFSTTNSTTIEDTNVTITY